MMILQVHDELVFEVDAGFVDTLREPVASAWRAPPNCGCRWWSMSASARTGTKRIRALNWAHPSKNGTESFLNPTVF